jgi:hypothetical protein
MTGISMVWAKLDLFTALLCALPIRRGQKIRLALGAFSPI